MVKRYVMFSAALSLLVCVAIAVAGGPQCDVPSSANRTLSLSIRGTNNGSGSWVTFSSFKDWNNSPDDVRVDVKRSVIDCGGKRIVHIQGVIRDDINEKHMEELLFHNKCGTNVAVINNGYSAQKIYINAFFGGGLLTNRPLNDNELFELRLENISSKFTHSVGIGVTTQSPNDIEIPEDMNRLRPKTWMLYDNNLWNNFTMVLKEYSQDLNGLKVSDRVGVMRSGTGALHFYVNGIDQGPAASNLPYSVYGVFELRGKAMKATIVGPSSLPSSS